MKAGYELALPEDEKDKPDPKFGSLWRGLNDTTTAHGIPRVRQYKGPKKIFWLFILLSCFVMVTYNTTSVFIDFLNFDVNVDVKIIPNVELPFPTVTICNLTPINRVALEQSTGLDNLKETLGTTSRKRRRKKRSAHPCPASNIDTSSGYCFLSHPDNIKLQYSAAVNACLAIGMEIAKVDTPDKQSFIQTNDLLGSSGHAWIGIEKSGGTYWWNDGSPVVYTNWKGAPSNVYARLDKKTYKWDDKPAARAELPFCQIYVVEAATTEATTIRQTTQTTTQTTTTPPDPDIPFREEFLVQEDVIEAISDLPEETKTSIGFTAAGMILDCQYAGRQCFISDFETVYNPIHGNCYMFNSGWNSNKTVLWSKQSGVRYGLHLTLDIHQDQYVTSIGKSAGARILINDQYKMPFPEDEGHHAPPGFVTAFGLKKIGVKRQPSPYGDCTKADKQNMNRSVYEETYPVQYSTPACMKTCYQHHVIGTCGCADPYVLKYGAAFDYKKVPSCDIRNSDQFACREAFVKLYTDGDLECNCPNPCHNNIFEPTISNAVWPSTVSKLELVAQDAPQYLNETEKIRQNLLKLEIFYNDFNYKEITEKPAYTWEKLISDLGGAFGLWVGWSILTIFEFLEFFTDFVVLALMKFSKDNTNKKNKARRLSVKPIPETKKTGMNTPFVLPPKSPPEQKIQNSKPASYSPSMYSGATSLGSLDSRTITPTDVTFDESRCSSQQTMVSNMTDYSTVSRESSKSESRDNLLSRSESSDIGSLRSRSSDHSSTGYGAEFNPDSSTATRGNKKRSHPLLYV